MARPQKKTARARSQAARGLQVLGHFRARATGRPIGRNRQMIASTGFSRPAAKNDQTQAARMPPMPAKKSAVPRCSMAGFRGDGERTA
jgi:hypothetical protein